MEAEPEQEATLFPATVGEKLRAAREAQGLELSEIAARTRIPQRHLEAIERSGYNQLPSITYALGFAKSYARAVGADEVAIGRELRAELGSGGSANYERPAPVPAYEMTDPTRTPPRGLVWISLVVAALVLVGVVVWYGTDWFRGSAPAPETLTTADDLDNAANANTTAVATTPPQSGGQVTLTALDSVWVRVSDASGKRLFEKAMAPGERYDVPQDADRPVAKTGRAEAIQVTINGSNVAPLGAASTTIEVGVSADALRARDPTAAPTASATTTPSASAPTRSSRPAPRPVPTSAVSPPEPAAGNATAP
jgi:cytoskeletal protein RodZ